MENEKKINELWDAYEICENLSLYECCAIIINKIDELKEEKK